MMRYKGTILLGCLLAIFAGCKKPGCLGSAGTVTTVTRNLTSFNELVLDSKINLILTQGSQNKIEITAPKNIEPNITTIISDNTLTIMNEGNCGWMRNPDETVSVHLYFTDLRKIDYKGSGNITNTDTLKLDHLQIESFTGAGDIELTLDNIYTGTYIMLENASIKLHGKSETCFTYTNARGLADMRDFTVKKMVIEYGGLGDTYVNVTDNLDAILYYKGNIFYKGDPVVSRNISYSSGKLLKVP
jgi:hypothetical protein